MSETSETTGVKLGAGGTAPRILVGAFDRHNFGDLLFAQIAASYLADRPFVAAGLVARDLSAVGGMPVTPLAELARRDHDAPVTVIHVGGEILTTGAWPAALMLAAPEEAKPLIARFDADPAAARAYAEAAIGLPDAAPYVVGRRLFPRARRIVFAAVGGADLACAEAALRDEVVAKLEDADLLFVRERATQQALAAAGIDAQLAPDPVAVIEKQLGARIAQAQGEVAACRARFPQGYLAVQFAAECGDDATLAQIAAALDAIAQASGWGLVFFRAGAAPWHDDLDVYRRCETRLRRARTHLFASLDVGSIAALIAGSRGFLGTSLHGHVVASAFALPRANFLPHSLSGRPNKIAAYLSTWEMPEMPGVVTLDALAEAFLAARAVAPERRKLYAQRLAALYHHAAEEIFAA